MILNDEWLINHKQIISPFSVYQITQQNHEKIISYGLSSFGYDIRLSNLFTFPKRSVSTNLATKPGRIDPKKSYGRKWQTDEADHFWIPPKGFVLGNSIEKIIMPEDVIGLCVGKSTYARCGIVCNVTPLEPGWRGYVTLELSNTTLDYVKVYANEGICQIMFFKGEKPITTYNDRKGKYQDQSNEPILAMMK
jgi:dCTP deaminase